MEIVCFEDGSRVQGVQLLRRYVKRLRRGLVCKAHRHLYHSTLGSRVIEKRREEEGWLLFHSTLGSRVIEKRRRRVGGLKTARARSGDGDGRRRLVQGLGIRD